MLMEYENHQGSFCVVSLGKMNSHSIIVVQNNLIFPFTKTFFFSSWNSAKHVSP